MAGFGLTTFNGHSGVLAHAAFHAGPAVGKYRVDVSAFERIGVEELERAVHESDIILIDEVGKMERQHGSTEGVRLCSEKQKRHQHSGAVSAFVDNLIFMCIIIAIRIYII